MSHPRPPTTPDPEPRPKPQVPYRIVAEPGPELLTIGKLHDSLTPGETTRISHRGMTVEVLRLEVPALTEPLPGQPKPPDGPPQPPLPKRPPFSAVPAESVEGDAAPVTPAMASQRHLRSTARLQAEPLTVTPLRIEVPRCDCLP